MGDQDHDCFFSSIMLENTGNQIPSAFDQVTPSKTITPTTKSPSSIIEKESYKKKKCDQLATNHLNQELLHEIKNYILSLQQDSKTDYMGEYIKAMLDQIASLKSDIMFLRGEVKGKNAFIEQLNNNNNNNIINRNNKAIMITMIIVFLIKLVIVLLISLTIIILVILLTALITIITILIMTVVLIKIITAITKMTIIIFLIKLVTVFLIYLTITILVMFLTALIMITIIIITAIITKIVKFSLK